MSLDQEWIRHLIAHPWQWLFVVLAVALGVTCAWFNKFEK